MFDFGDLAEDGETGGDVCAEAGEISVFYPGDVVKGYFLQAQWYLATITRENSDGTYTVDWNDGDAKDQIKPISELKLVRRGPNAKDSDADAAEAEKAAQEQAEREASERTEEAERKAREEQESAEAEQKAKDEKERAEKEAKVEKELAEQAAKEKAEAEEAAKKAQESAEKPPADEKGESPPAEAEEAAKKAQESAEKPPADEKGESPPAEDDDDDDDLPDLLEEEDEKPEQSEETALAQTQSDEASQEEIERRQKAAEEQQKNAAFQRRERDRRVLERAGGRMPGVRVKLKDMTEKPQMNGAMGTLVEEKGERWVVNLDGCPGVGKGKWMVNRKNLLAAQWNCDEPKVPYSIVGSWNNWSPTDMTWDIDSQSWRCTVKVGDRGWESFQFISEGDANKCIHPDQKDASPHMPHKMLGPDFEGHGQNWSVGKHPLDKGRKGAEYEVRFFVWEDEAPRSVEWSKPESDSQEAAFPKVSKKERFCIAGTWDNWVVKEMEWDEENQHYHNIVQLTSQGWESFQILLEGDYKRCLHPSISEANPYVPYTLCGPDNRGHGKNWTIGKHALDKGCKGAKYNVRYFPAVGGRVGLVDWEPVTGNTIKKSEAKSGADKNKKRYCVAGTWGNWAATDMAWDEKRRCFHYTVRLGLNGWESFQILVDGDYKMCLHPDSNDATPHDKHEILGPDQNGHGKNWTIGRHRLDLGSRGSRFEVRLYVDDASEPTSIDWERLQTPGVGTRG